MEASETCYVEDNPQSHLALVFRQLEGTSLKLSYVFLVRNRTNLL